MPGYFNISAFHNSFSDQQLQIGVQCNPTANCPQTTVVLNTGKSRLQGSRSRQASSRSKASGSR
jgi:hypothetical protein